MEDAETRLKNLSEQANHQVDHSHSIKMYYRSGQEMVRMANVYADEGNLAAAYVLYLKFLTIFVEKIRDHPQYKQVSVTEKALIRRYLPTALSRAETLKKQLRVQFEREHQQWLTDQKNSAAEMARQRQIQNDKQKSQQHSDQQQRRFEQEKESVLEAERRRAELVEQSISSSSNSRHLSQDVADLLPSPPTGIPVANNINNNNNNDVNISRRGDGVDNLASAPQQQQQQQQQQQANDSHTNSRPVVDRSVKPGYNSGAMSLMSLRSELRTVVVPDCLLDRFLKIAELNTTNNVETCALLCGKPCGSVLRITHLVVPQQQGGADWCTTQDEERIIEHMDRHNLITLGWIHTHPSQTAFLSSMDLHTHYSHQMCIAESIAIVCAPKYKQTGFFHLTTDHGLTFIGNCCETGFHPHPSHPPLFTDAQHVTLDSNASVDVVDLRQ